VAATEAGEATSFLAQLGVDYRLDAPLGYGRLGDPELVGPINRLDKESWGLLNNFFLPSMKLKEKWREGSRWVRRHDQPQTADQRLLASGQVETKERRRLQDLYHSLDPFQLARQMELQLGPVLKAVLSKKPSATLQNALRAAWHVSFDEATPPHLSGPGERCLRACLLHQCLGVI
jgi:hypothetical protein